MKTVRFEVMGKPATKGSFKPMGKFVKHDNKNLQGWAGFVAWTARQAWDGPPTERLVQVTAVYWRRRPKDHFRANGDLKPGMPTHWGKTPDGDKMERALWDALSGIVFVDDKQVCVWCGEKVYGAVDCTAVRIEELPDHD